METILVLALGLALPSSSAQPEASREFQSISVKPGETLEFLAKTYLKDPTSWGEFLRHNALPTKDPNAALPGLTLRMPIKLIREEYQAARLIYRQNQVYFRRKEGVDWNIAGDSMDLYRNDAIKTLGDGKAVVRFADNDLMQVDPGSMAIVMPTAKDYHVELKRGGVVAANKKIMMGSAVIAPASPNTVFTASIQSDKSTLVQVYKGQASVKSGGKDVKVDAGQAVNVKEGLVPSLPFKIPDLKALKSWVGGFEAQLMAMKKKAGQPVPAEEPTPEAPKETDQSASDRALKQAAKIQAPTSVSSYRIQCAIEEDFQHVLTDRNLDADVKLRPNELGLPPGKYWCRVAAIDLMGEQGPFKTPKIYTVGDSP